MKKTFKILGIILLVLIILIAFHTLNTLYPSNIVKRTLNGISLVLTPVLIAAVLVYLINPFTEWLIKKRGLKKHTAIIITIALLIISLAAIIYFVVVFFVEQGREVFQSIFTTDFLETLRNWFEANNLVSIYDYIENFVLNYDYQSLITSGSSILSAVIQIITTIILVPIFLWHILKHKDIIMDKVSENLPHSWKNHVIPIANKSNTVVVAYFKSKILSIILLFIMFTIFYLILGMPITYVIFFSALISILDIIPYIGPTVGLAVPIIYIFSVGGVDLFYQGSMHLNAMTANIVLILINFLIQLLQGNYIVPKLAGKQMNINPALILVFMLFFGSILGVWGVVLSIPLGGIIIVIWTHLKESGLLDDKNKQTET